MNENLREKYSDVLQHYNEQLEGIEYFHGQIKLFMERRSLRPYVHSVRHRLKDVDHLLRKIERKNLDDMLLSHDKQKGPITAENLFERITDMAGIRVLHLHLSQFEHIHRAIMDSDFVLYEYPKAYTWDPDTKIYFESIDEKLNVETKESYYTSIHYVLKPNQSSPITCEIQVRTLLEEVWGEVDHTMNYPERTDSVQCAESIKVLARLVGAGGHLADSIMKHHG